MHNLNGRQSVQPRSLVRHEGLETKAHQVAVVEAVLLVKNGHARGFRHGRALQWDAAALQQPLRQLYFGILHVLLRVHHL